MHFSNARLNFPNRPPYPWPNSPGARLQRKRSIFRAQGFRNISLTLAGLRPSIHLARVGAPPVRGKGILPPNRVRGDIAEPSSSLYSADFRHDGGSVP
jgi:hypothetical protein